MHHADLEHGFASGSQFLVIAPMPPVVQEPGTGAFPHPAPLAHLQARTRSLRDFPIDLVGLLQAPAPRPSPLGPRAALAPPRAQALSPLGTIPVPPRHPSDPISAARCRHPPCHHQPPRSHHQLARASCARLIPGTAPRTPVGGGFAALTLHTPGAGLGRAPLPLPRPLAARRPQPRPDAGRPPPPARARARAPLPAVRGQPPPVAAAFVELQNPSADPAALARRSPRSPGGPFRPGHRAGRNGQCAAVKSVGYCLWVLLVTPPLLVHYEGG
jgi:hypothetical protein